MQLSSEIQEIREKIESLVRLEKECGQMVNQLNAELLSANIPVEVIWEGFSDDNFRYFFFKLAFKEKTEQLRSYTYRTPSQLREEIIKCISNRLYFGDQI
jgi:hypothetical protein